MREVTVRRVALQEKLEANKIAHQQVFEEALEGYRKLAIETFEKALADARAGKRIRSRIYLEQPINQTREYERALAMCAMSVDDTIKLTSQEFESYVMDRWPWRQSFLKAAANYSVAASTTYHAEGGGDEDEG